jgi:hypothetical protein
LNIHLDHGDLSSVLYSLELAFAGAIPVIV